jgi:general secretion pathway protein G
MSKIRRRSAFTLIEVLIVVIIMAVLAATIIPQFSSTTKDARESSVRFNLHSMRSQIELYKEHHMAYPTTGKFVAQMTQKTLQDGTPDAAGTYGPYIQGGIPANPLNNSSGVAEGDGSGVKTGDYGWQYDPTTGKIYVNYAGYLNL